MNKEEKVEYWIELSDYDLETSEAMLISKRYLYVGYMCHQTIEKILKAYFVSNKNDNPPYTHNLSYLAEKTGLLDQLMENQLLFLDELEPLNIESRYPEHKGKVLKFLTAEKCLTLLKKTKELQQWIKKKL
jgi:HEPN domain-containing protein